ncbi:zinc finger protein 608 [Aplochiton taeniatus]
MLIWTSTGDKGMNRFQRGKNGPLMEDGGELSSFLNATTGSTYPAVIRGNVSKESRKYVLKGSKTPNSEASPFALCGINPEEICAGIGRRREAQGRPGEALEMNSAPGQAVSNVHTADITASCAKGKEERKGKNLLRGWKRDATVRARKEKHSDGQTSPAVFSSTLPEHLPTVANRETQSHRADGGMVDVGKNGLDCGIKGSAIVVRRHDDTGTPSKKQRTEKVDPMFTVPAPPTLGHPGPPGPLPLAPSSSPVMPLSPKQVLVRTRSVGTNTQDGVVLRGHEADEACLGPCQPGTSVNLEGIVWHETEEGVLVVNVTWRKRTYVGTLLDCTKHDWAPPRFCESPSSDPEMLGGRGRGKRMRLAIPERPCTDPGPPKVRGLSQHRSRGGGVAGVGGGTIHTKGRRGSLNLINSNCRTPPFFTVEEVKTPNSTSLSSGKRKNKPPADLDLSLVADDVKNGNGKRIRAKSRSAPSTPQGKSDPTFLDSSGCTTTTSPPILIDCPHPNCTKKYKHINGLRYHQTHAHLEAAERKPELEAETEDRLSDCEETLNNAAFEISETTTNSNSCSGSSKKPGPMYKVTTVGSPKNRRLLLSTDHSPTANAKTRRHSLLKEGLIDDLSNLPIISNMTVVLENCMVTDRNSTVEMPKLEAEGLIDKKAVCDKGKKANGKVEKCLTKSRTNRPIAPAPAPPKLIAIPNAPYPTSTNAADSAPQQPSPVPGVGLTTKNLPLKPIKPKLSIVVEPGLVKTTIVTCKEPRKKEKRRLKDKHNKDAKTRTPNGDNINIQLKMEDGNTKIPPREPAGSLLKEHLSKHDGVNGLTETQESRMASIRAEADKVYTFTDNAPSPSIGSSSRLDASSLTSGDGGSSKNNSPAYSDISDAGDDGGLSDCRSEARSKCSSVTSEVTSNNNHGNPASKTPPAAPAGPPVVKDSQSPFYHGYDPYYLQGYVQSGQTFHKSSSSHESKVKREDAKEEEKLGHEKTEGSQSQLHLAMSQTQTALAQSLYYGQYARGLYMDQKLLMASKCCDQQQASGKQRGDRGPTAIRDTEEVKHIVTSSAGMTKDSGKSCCPKPGLSYVEMGERGQNLAPQHGGKYGSVVDNQHKDCDDMKSQSALNANNPTDLDSNVSFSNPPDIQTWARLNQPKYVDQNHGEESEDVDPERAKDWDSGPEVGANMGGGGAGDLKKAKNLELPSTMDDEDCDGLERMDQEQEPMGSEDSQNARVAVSPPMTPQQPYIQYQHSYPYLQMCEAGNGSYRGVSPTLAHSYPGFHYPLYGKTAGREESDVTQSGRSSSSKQSNEATAMELLQQQSLQYHGKSPAAGEKGSPEGEREVERERSHVAFARHLHTHHHTHMGMTYPLMTGQYDLYQENEGKK